MPIPIESLVERIATEVAATSKRIETANREARDSPERLRLLMTDRTDAFVALARHYLPDLSHRSVANSWSEVRGKLTDAFLVKERECRLLREKVDHARAAREDQERQLNSIRAQAERARLDLKSKSGSVDKSLRDDPAITRCHAAIVEVDTEIEAALARMEVVTAQASAKLPEYEQCSLFQYLKERQYGTADYDASRFERRWDNWVARLIDYQKAKQTYDFFTRTPVSLQKLIDKKTLRYKELLKELEALREREMQIFRISKAIQRWEQLSQIAAACEQDVQRLCRAEAHAQQELNECESLNGQHYSRAVQVYCQFLSDLDSEILRVYAACTDSPVDDEICAQLRQIQTEIRDHQTLSTQNQDRIVKWKKYLSGLREITIRLTELLRHAPLKLRFRNESVLADCLRDLERRVLNCAQAWRMIRLSIVGSSDGANDAELQCDMTHAIPLLDAVFYAASGPQSVWEPKIRTDLSGVVVSASQGASDIDRADAPIRYTTLALCGTSAEAGLVTSLLDSNNIPCFFRRHDSSASFGSISQRPPAVEHVHVMVDASQFKVARQIVLDCRQQQDAGWECPGCTAAVDPGYDLCWRCGATRPKMD